MSSARSAEPAASDLTSQARIRNVAVAHFARDGFQKANLRAIAEEAGVSVALIFHHFDSKDGLRRTCDEHVLGVVADRARSAGDPAGTRDLLGVYLSDPEGYQLYVQYLARAIQEDAPAAATIAGTMVDESEAAFLAGADDGTMRPSTDPRALAVLNILISLAVFNMPPPLVRALGYERFGPDALGRLAVPVLELYTYGVYADDALLTAVGEAWDEARPARHGKD